jgi:hypothetical protein
VEAQVATQATVARAAKAGVRQTAQQIILLAPVASAEAVVAVAVAFKPPVATVVAVAVEALVYLVKGQVVQGELGHPEVAGLAIPDVRVAVVVVEAPVAPTQAAHMAVAVAAATQMQEDRPRELQVRFASFGEPVVRFRRHKQGMYNEKNNNTKSLDCTISTSSYLMVKTFA